MCGAHTNLGHDSCQGDSGGPAVVIEGIVENSTNPKMKNIYA